MLVGKGEMRIFEEVVEKAGEFAHDGDEGDFFEFSGVKKVLIEVFEMAVVDDGNHGGHVESRAWDGAATGDLPTALGLTTVGVEGSQTEEMSGLATA